MLRPPDRRSSPAPGARPMGRCPLAARFSAAGPTVRVVVDESWLMREICIGLRLMHWSRFLSPCHAGPEPANSQFRRVVALSPALPDRPRPTPSNAARRRQTHLGQLLLFPHRRRGDARRLATDAAPQSQALEFLLVIPLRRYGCSLAEAPAGWPARARDPGGVCRPRFAAVHRTASCPPICRYYCSCRSLGVLPGIGLTPGPTNVARPRVARSLAWAAYCSTLSLAFWPGRTATLASMAAESGRWWRWNCTADSILTPIRATGSIGLARLQRTVSTTHCCSIDGRSVYLPCFQACIGWRG